MVTRTQLTSRGPAFGEGSGGKKHLALTDTSLPRSPPGSCLSSKSRGRRCAQRGLAEESEARGSEHVLRTGTLGKGKTRGHSYPTVARRRGGLEHRRCSMPCSSVRNMQAAKFLCDLFEALHLSKQLSRAARDGALNLNGALHIKTSPPL